MHIAKRFILIIVMLALCVGCDQTTKSVAKTILAETETLSFLGDVVRFQLAHNQGAFLSMGSSLPEAWRHSLFLVGAGCMLLALLSYVLFSKSVSRSEIFALTLLLAGGVGNLTDRITYNGYVVDFINIGIGPLRTGIFNIADIAITAGALILIGGMLRDRNKSF